VLTALVALRNPPRALPAATGSRHYFNSLLLYFRCLQALYNAYYERQLPIMKEDLPGLKLSQYKDRIFEAWKKSSENPANQAK
jgi:hypothetical protein